MSIYTKPPQINPTTIINTLTQMAQHPGNYGWAPQEAINLIQQLQNQNTINNAIIALQDQLLHNTNRHNTNPRNQNPKQPVCVDVGGGEQQGRSEQVWNQTR